MTSTPPQARPQDPADATPTRAEFEALMASRIARYQDFPQPGILFRDISPLLADAAAFRATIAYWRSQLPADVEYVVGTEARGFVLGAPLAYEIGAGFVPVRKAGKVPGDPRRVSYDLEYGSATVEMATDALPAGARTVIVDDLLATGGTARATAQLIQACGAELLGASFLIELQGLGGREVLSDLPVTALWSIPN